MAVATFDTLKFSNTLKAAGVPDRQAEAEANALNDIFSVNFKELVTKDDLRLEIASLRSDLKNDIALLKSELKSTSDAIRTEMKNDIGLLRAEFRSELRESEQRVYGKLDTHMALLGGQIALLKWMLGLFMGILTAIGIRIFFFSHITL